MVKCSVSMEGKEGSWRECWFESDGEQEVKVEEAWTKWAFSVFKRPASHLRIRPYGFGDTRGTSQG
jgi:hypothetical protein